jgi:hypothetical protein
MKWSCIKCQMANEAARATCCVCRAPNPERGRLEARVPAATAGDAVDNVAGRSGEPAAGSGIRTPDASGSLAALAWRGPGGPAAHLLANGGSAPSALAATAAAISSAAATRVIGAPRAGAATPSTMKDVMGGRTRASRAGGAGSAGRSAAADDWTPAPVDAGRFPELDPGSRDTWEWPTSEDYAERAYQLQITAASLFHNTLVSLPTGMGKTFIAAVVLHNFYR